MYSFLTVSDPIGRPPLVILHIFAGRIGKWRPGTLESRLEHSQIRLLWSATFKIKIEK